MIMKRLYRTEGPDAILCGVCGGIARFFNVDPTVVRLATVLLVAFAGLSLWVYIIAALVMPKESSLY
ncbi:MAG: PspC domain-containing protein [Clostridiales bacterium]|nr:PspC domain-containing protein [Clostridiales bacterium]